MEGKEAIIKKIIEDANLKATAIIDNAESQRTALIDEAKAWANEYERVQLEEMNKDANDIVSRRITVADLDVRKILLSAKRSVLDLVFVKAYEKLCKLPKNEYLAFTLKMITAYADDGDVILLSSDNVLSAKDFESEQVFKSKKLSVAKEKGDFIGGVKLINPVCDKDLSFSAVISGIKEDYSLKTAEKIFG